MHVNPGALVIVKTNTMENAVGRIDNGGQIIVEENFINSDTATGNNTRGVYDVFGNWENNDFFRADSSIVNLPGADQLITGTAITSFFDLSLQGSGIKRQTIDAEVTNILELNNRELATDEHEMWVSNTDPLAITRSTGFVSSLDIGRLSRSTGQTSTYLYPTGSSLGVYRYRPVQLTPEDNAANVFGVRLANVDPTLEGFDREVKDEQLCDINPEFYHRIYHTAGKSSTDVAIFYYVLDDGEWSTMAHWQNVPQWEEIAPISNSQGIFNSLTVDSWSNFGSSPFALANPVPQVTLSEDTAIWFDETVQLFADISPNTEVEWIPDQYLDCTYCTDPISDPDSTSLYIVEASNISSCFTVDSVLVTVRFLDEIMIPTGFTPNGDGFNDRVGVLGAIDLVNEIEFVIFNRWGQKVYQANDIDEAARGWDGTFRGKPQDMESFVYYIKADLDRRGEILQQGTITLIR